MAVALKIYIRTTVLQGRIPKRSLTFPSVWPYRQLMERFSPIFGLCGLISVNGALKFEVCGLIGVNDAPFPLIRTSFSELLE